MLAAALLSLPLAISGDLRFAATRDPISDQPRIVAELGDDHGGIGVGCMGERSHRLFVLVIFDQFIGNTRAGPLAGGTRVQYRFDSAPPLTDRGDALKNVVMFVPSDPSRFLAGLRTSKSLYVRAFGRTGLPHDASFSYADPTGAVPQMLDRCGLDAGGGVKDR